MRCSAYINGKQCTRRATYILHAPSLNKTMDRHPLCSLCAEERKRIKAYPWSITKIGGG